MRYGDFFPSPVAGLRISQPQAHGGVRRQIQQPSHPREGFHVQENNQRPQPPFIIPPARLLPASS